MKEENHRIPLQRYTGDIAYTLRKPFMRKKPRISINILLFILTLGSTWFIGIISYFEFNHPDAASLEYQQLLFLFIKNPSLILNGLYYSLGIMLFLIAHEGGHYLTCRYYNIDATLPYFIPAPTLIGTFGAFIKIRAPITNKKVLFDIGIAGPLSGFVVALPTMVYGIMMSRAVPPAESAQGIYLSLGEPLIFKVIQSIMLPSLPEGYDLVLHPLAFVGWFGCLATCLNLFPVSQLDGGHIAYSILGKHYAKISKLIFFSIIVIGIIYWYLGWLFWALIIFFLGFKHPPTLNDELPVGRSRKVLAFIALLLLILTFTPKPIYIN